MSARSIPARAGSPASAATSANVDRLVIVLASVRASTFYASRHSDASVVTETSSAAAPQTARDVRDNSPQRGSRRPSESSDLVWGHCQLKRPWYAARVGGAAARVGELLCSLTVLPRSSRAGLEKGALGPLS